MTKKSSNLEDLIMPSVDVTDTDQKLEFTEKAIEKASSQAVLLDVLTVSIGNIFAFFALIFPSLTVSVIELTSQARQPKKSSDDN